MHGLFPRSLLFSYSIPTWLFIFLLILKLLIDFFWCLSCFVCFSFFFLIFHLNLIMFVFFFNPCLVFVFAFFFRRLSFDQRRPSTFVSNSIESFCVPRSWTANFSRRSKRHRTHGKRLFQSVNLSNQTFLL